MCKTLFLTHGVVLRVFRGLRFCFFLQHAMMLPVLTHHIRYHQCLMHLDKLIGYMFKERCLLQVRGSVKTFVGLFFFLVFLACHSSWALPVYPSTKGCLWYIYMTAMYLKFSLCFFVYRWQRCQNDKNSVLCMPGQ